jgi:hypothetical protein
MELAISSRLRHAWDAFAGNRDPTAHYRTNYYGAGTGYRPDRARFTRGNEKSIVTAIYNRIAMDVAALTIQHVQLNAEGQFIDVVKSGLNDCLNLKANIDQTGRAFVQDLVMSMLDEGCVAAVATRTTKDPRTTEAYDVLEMRTGKVLEWYPKHVKVRVYNEENGRKEEIILAKENVAIIENPLYAVCNEKNSIMQRLIRKLNLLDAIDEQSGSGKLDILVQLPYTIKTQARRDQAETRRKDIENQLNGSKYGIAYIDGTERVTQLNRPVENNLMKQIEFLTNMGYGQLGITQGVMDGTADEKTMRNYQARTVEPIASAIVDALKCTYLSRTAITQGKSVMCFTDPFTLAPLSDIAEISEKFVANGIMSANDIRGKMGMKPSEDEQANKLTNSRIKQPAEAPMEPGADPAMDPAAADPADGGGSVMDVPISEVM